MLSTESDVSGEALGLDLKAANEETETEEIAGEAEGERTKEKGDKNKTKEVKRKEEENDDGSQGEEERTFAGLTDLVTEKSSDGEEDDGGGSQDAEGTEEDEEDSTAYVPVRELQFHDLRYMKNQVLLCSISLVPYSSHRLFRTATDGWQLIP